ncbi:MAG: hypothetical protein ACE5E9_01860 [Nitrospinaceae bacterium]
MKDPERFAKGLSTVYTGLTLTMSGVALMLVLYFTRPEHVLHPTWLLLLGLGVVAWGEWQKFRSK